MKTITINNKDVDIISTPDELTLAQLKELTNLSKDNGDDDLEKGAKLLKLLSVNELKQSDIDNIELTDFLTLITSISFDKTDYPIRERFEHNDVVYMLQGNDVDFKFNYKQIKGIKKAMTQDNFNYLHKMAAILYTAPESSRVEREGIFQSNMTADYMLPLLEILMKTLKINV